MKTTTQQVFAFLLLFGALLQTNAQDSPALTFTNASNNYIQWDDATTTVETDESFTIEMYVKSNGSTANNQNIYTEGPSSTYTGHFRMWVSSGKLNIRPTHSSSYQLGSESAIFNDTNWHHIAVVGTPDSLDADSNLATNRMLQIYVDGSLQAPGGIDILYYPKTVTDFNRACLGNYHRNQTTSNAFDGNIDEFRSWSVARTPTQLSYNTCDPETTIGLTRHIRFNEALGTTVSDEVSGGATGTISGTSPSWTTNSSCGPSPIVNLGGALEFTNANNNYIQWTDDTTLTETDGDFTIEMWVKSKGATANSKTLYSEGPSNTTGAGIFRVWVSSGRLVVRPTNSSSLQLLSADAIFADDTSWYHIAVVGTPDTLNGDADGATDRVLKIYVNGVLQTFSSKNTLYYTKSASDFTQSGLGSYHRGQSTSNSFDGEIDEFRTWSVARTVSQITNNYCAPETSTGLVRHLRFNQSTGTTVTDEVTGAKPTVNEDQGSLTWTLNSSCVSTLSTRKISLKNKLNIYPNPSNSVINIDSEFQINEIVIFDLSGKKVHNTNTSDPIDVSSFSKGIYLLKIVSEKGEITYKKIVIN